MGFAVVCLALSLDEPSAQESRNCSRLICPFFHWDLRLMILLISVCKKAIYSEYLIYEEITLRSECSWTRLWAGRPGEPEDGGVRVPWALTWRGRRRS